VSFRNVDGSPEMLESGSAQLYSRILFANSTRRQRGGRLRERGSINRTPEKEPRGVAAVIREKAGNLGGLLSVFILSFTVVAVLAIGIVSAYGSVIGILHSFAKQTHRTQEKPVLAPGQARAAHAGGD
jgi:hypothetical protein